MFGLRFFTPHEFSSTSFFHRCQSEMEKQCQEDPFKFVDAYAARQLDLIRQAAGIPFILTCSYRSSLYDKCRGRSGDSAHCQGKAFDIRCKDSDSRFRIVKAALSCGCSRIGIAPTYVHLDFSDTLPRARIWLYESASITFSSNL